MDLEHKQILKNKFKESLEISLLKFEIFLKTFNSEPNIKLLLTKPKYKGFSPNLSLINISSFFKKSQTAIENIPEHKFNVSSIPQKSKEFKSVSVSDVPLHLRLGTEDLSLSLKCK